VVAVTMRLSSGGSGQAAVGSHHQSGGEV